MAEAASQVIALRQEKVRLEGDIQKIDALLDHWENILTHHRALNEKQAEPPEGVPVKARSGRKKKLGLTAGIRLALHSAPKNIGLTPTEIRDKLTEWGIKSKNEENFLANIHSILKRRMPDVVAIVNTGDGRARSGGKRRWAIRRYILRY